MGQGQLDHKFRGIMEPESQLLGRVTFESFAGAWPELTGSQTIPSGVVIQTYERADNAPAKPWPSACT